MQIGQITSKNISENSVVEDLTETEINYKYFSNTDNTTVEKGLLKKSVFEKDKTYYLKLKLTSSATSFPQKVKVKLCNIIKDNVTEEMPIRLIPNFIDNRVYDFIFTPDKNYSYFIIISTDGKQCSISFKDIFCEEISNVLNQTGYSLIRDIGIQGSPGLRFAINGEGFTLGKSGNFYLSDLDITNIGFHLRGSIEKPFFPQEKNSKEFFIMSFQY
jgi:hypothetical protein